MKLNLWTTNGLRKQLPRMPVSITRSSSRQSTLSTPPSVRTRTLRSVKPFNAAATADAHEPVPDERVCPAPRSQIRISISSREISPRELDICAIREDRMVFDKRADLVQVYSVQIRHKDDALRIAHRQASHFEHVSAKVQAGIALPDSIGGVMDIGTASLERSACPYQTRTRSASRLALRMCLASHRRRLRF